jgi:predicted homoserine dehydrogenase-like protein
VLFGEGHMRPLPVPTAEVGCRAKRDLAIGETLDAIGEYSYRGFALSVADARDHNALPIGLAQGARIIRSVVKGELITRHHAEPDATLNIVAMRQRQDALVAQSA